MRHGWWSVCSRPWLFLLLASALVRARAFQPSSRKDRIGQRRPSRLVYETKRDESAEPFFLSSSQTTAGRSSERHRSTTEEDADSLHGPRSRCCCLWLKLSYDGRRFDGGWDDVDDVDSTNGPPPIIIKTTIRKRTRAANRRRVRRSVKSELQTNMARLYGNLASARIVVRSTVPSLDPGVYAVGLVVQVAGLVEDETTKQLVERKKQASELGGIEGGVEEDVASTSSYRTSSSKDTNVMLLPLPTPPHRMCIALNRLLDDVQVKAYSTTGCCCSSSMNGLLHDDHPWVPPPPRVVVTTYAYRLSFGPRPDPIQRHQVWHINCDSTTDSPPSTILGRLQAASDRCRLAETVHGAGLDGDSRVVVSRPNGDETDWHGTWRCDVTVTTGGGRNCAADRAVRSHVAEIVQDVFGDAVNDDDDTSTLLPPPATTTTATTMAPAHGLVLVNVQCSNGDGDDEDLVWHAAHRYVFAFVGPF